MRENFERGAPRERATLSVPRAVPKYTERGQKWRAAAKSEYSHSQIASRGVTSVGVAMGKSEQVSVRDRVKWSMARTESGQNTA